MFDEMCLNIKTSDDYKKAVYYLKGKYDNLDVLPLEDFGENIFALTIGSPKNSKIICSGFNSSFEISVFMVLKFIDEFLTALQFSKTICNISPTKILQTASFTFIPSIINENLISGSNEELLLDLSMEWEAKRLYILTEGMGKNKIIYSKSSQCSPHTYLMAEMLSSCSSYTASFDENRTFPIIHDFSKNLNNPALIIKTGGEVLPLTVSSIDSVYARLHEILMLALIL